MRLHALSLLPLLAALLLVVAPAAGDPGTQKQQVDAKIDHLEDQIARAEGVSGTLTSEISAATAVIRAVQDDVSAEEARLNVLEAELAGTQAELDRLTELLADQTSRLERLRGEHAAAVRRLESTRTRDLPPGHAGRALIRLRIGVLLGSTRQRRVPQQHRQTG